MKLYGKGVSLDASADGTTLKMKRHQIAKAGQVILSEIWGKKGAISFVPIDGDGALCTSHFFLFDVRCDKIDPKWLQAIFSANYLQGQLDAEAKGTTGYAAVRPKHLLAAKIPLPPLSEQKRIVARLEELAEKIEEARGLRQQTVAEEESLIVSCLLHLTTQAHWEQKHIADCSEMSTGTTPPSERSDYFGGPLQWYTPGDLNGQRQLGRSSRTLSEAAIRDKKTRLFVAGTVLLVAIGGSLGKVGLAHERCSANQQITGIKFNAEIQPEFGFWWMRRLSKDLMDAAPQATLPIINQTRIGQFQIVIPPLSEQRRIVAYLDGLQAKVDALKRLQYETAAELNAMLPSVMDKAFKGELV